MSASGVTCPRGIGQDGVRVPQKQGCEKNLVVFPKIGRSKLSEDWMVPATIKYGYKS